MDAVPNMKDTRQEDLRQFQNEVEQLAAEKGEIQKLTSLLCDR